MDSPAPAAAPGNTAMVGLVKLYNAAVRVICFC